jgi:hypothetical protein
MTVYYVDDGGTSPDGLSWATAYTTLAALQTGVPTAFTTNGNVVYVGSDSIDAGVNATVTITGPTTGIVNIISATVGTTTYAKATSNQIRTITSSGNTIGFVGGLALWGIRANSSGYVNFTGTSVAVPAESFMSSYECYAIVANNRPVSIQGSGSGSPTLHYHENITISAESESGAQSGAFLKFGNCDATICRITFVNSASGRTGPIIDAGNTNVHTSISGADFSAISGASAIVSQTNAIGRVVVENSKSVASPTYVTGSRGDLGSNLFVRCTSAANPEGLYYSDYLGSVASTAAIYRNGGGVVEAIPVSWKLISTTHAYTSFPLFSPWIYGVLASTGSKTFTLYVTQDGGAGDLTDADVWLEVEYMGTSSVSTYGLGTDRCIIDGFFSGAAAQTDDTTSTWTGSITATYKQSLAVTATVNEEGLYRARVALAKASTTLYVDPLVTVS